MKYLVDVPECRAALNESRSYAHRYPGEVEAAEQSVTTTIDALAESAVVRAAFESVVEEVLLPAAAAILRDTRSAMTAVDAAVEEYVQADIHMVAGPSGAMPEDPL